MSTNMSNIIIILLLSVIAATQAQEDCAINVTTIPLIIVDENFNIRLSNNSDNSVIFSFNETFHIRCPQDTTSTLIAGDGEEVRCLHDTTVKIVRNSDSLDLTSVDCEEMLPYRVRQFGIVCQGTNGMGNMVEAGFYVSDHWIQVYQVCFDQARLTPFFGRYYVAADKWGRFLPDSKPPTGNFKDAGHFYHGIDIDGFYLEQKTIFENLGLGGYITEDTYLIPRQLFPSYIFIYPVEKDVSLDYIQVVPGWSSQGYVFEEYVYNYALEINYTGQYSAAPYGVATLPNDAGEEVELYLYGYYLPIPRWLRFQYINFNFMIWAYNNPYYNASQVEAEYNELCPNSHSFSDLGTMVVGVCITS